MNTRISQAETGATTCLSHCRVPYCRCSHAGVDMGQPCHVPLYDSNLKGPFWAFTTQARAAVHGLSHTFHMADWIELSSALFWQSADAACSKSCTVWASRYVCAGLLLGSR